jgi:GNAT superfamily N-acetyltransferase
VRPTYSPRFRLATVSDLGALTTLVGAYYEHDGIAFDARDIERSLRKLLERPEAGASWLIEVDGETAGYFILVYAFDAELGGDVGTITDLYLVPSQRHRGVGQATMRFIEAMLRDRGIFALELQAERSNTKAIAFYEAFGMTAHDRIPFSKRL